MRVLSNPRNRLSLLLAMLALAIGLAFARDWISEFLSPVTARLRGRATVAQQMARFGPAVRARLGPHFAAAGASYPPAGVVLLALKQERRLEVYAEVPGRGPVFIRAYPVLAASGKLGPKLRLGDGQVPEGVYPIASLNPNSDYHLSLKVGYPTLRERWQGVREGRLNLGGDIFIHGSNVSIGCLAMGDEAAEDLFVLAAETGVGRVRAVISPVDFRASALPPEGKPARPWVGDLYRSLEFEVRRLPPPGPRDDERTGRLGERRL